MSGRRETSLIKLYKDLMITRRDLIDLRESINNTIHSIKESDDRLQLIQAHRNIKQGLQAGTKTGKREAPWFALKIKARCDHCNLAFATNEALCEHIKEKHQVCEDCRDELTETLEEHLLFSCGQSKIKCESCSLLIKKMDLDAHVKVCCYRECYKCRRDIYFRAYSFHLQQCKRSQNLIPPCRTLYRPKHTNQQLAMPCCLLSPSS